LHQPNLQPARQLILVNLVFVILPMQLPTGVHPAYKPDEPAITAAFARLVNARMRATLPYTKKPFVEICG